MRNPFRRVSDGAFLDAVKDIQSTKSRNPYLIDMMLESGFKRFVTVFSCFFTFPGGCKRFVGIQSP
jgi:hypothetical protein